MTNTITKVISFISAIVIAASCLIIPNTYANTTSAYEAGGNQAERFILSESMFTEAELKLADKLLDGFLNRDDTISLTEFKIPGSDYERVYTIADYVDMTHPEIFWTVDNACAKFEFASGLYSSKITGNLTEFKQSYWFSKSEMATAQAKVDKAISTLLDSINDDWSDIEKAMYVHDYIASICSYNDNEDDNVATIYSVFVLHEANCRGYSRAYQYIMNELGIDCIWANSEDHLWNKIKIDGEWYNVDVCKDDLAERTQYVTDPSTFAQNSVLYTYFMVSDDVMEEEHGKVYSLYSADDTSYDNAFWRSTRTQFVYHDATDTWYGCTDDGIVSYCFATNKLKRIYSFKENWKANSGKAHYAVNLSNVVMDGNMIYFNTNKAVLSYNISTKTLRTVVTSSGCQSGVKQIYYLYASNNTLKYAVGTDMYTITNIYKAKDL